MKQLLSWQLIFDDFRRRYPALSSMVLNWYPSDSMVITLHFIDGTKMTYNYVNKTAATWPNL